MTMIHRAGVVALRALGCAAALATLAACGTGPAPNDVAEGVGFSDYREYQVRREALRNPAVPITPAQPVQTALPPADVAAEPFATVAAGQTWVPVAPEAGSTPTRAAQTDVASLASAAIAEAETATAAPGLPPVAAAADEFEAPPLPEGMVVLGANVVAFALSTDHAVGEQVYSRFPFRLGRPEVRCGDFRTTDLAQDWFLTNDGPERDRAGLDPDGDGFACNWDPERYRAEARAAAMPQVPAPGAALSDG